MHRAADLVTKVEGFTSICICTATRMVRGCPRHAPGDTGTPESHHAMLIRIIENQEKMMSQSQSDVDAATAFDTQLDTDLKALTAQVGNGTAAFDAAIAALKAANPGVDTSGLVAAQAVLAGDQPNLDAAVAAQAADPNIAPPAAPAAPADGSDSAPAA